MEIRHVINESYYCLRPRAFGVIHVLTGNSYVVAEYDERTGNIRWQRVVNATQREGIQHWLREHFPYQAEQVAEPRPRRAAKTRAQSAAA